MKKPKPYAGGDLEGDWLVSLKIDGIRVSIGPEGVFSRSGKPLYNMDHLVTDVQRDAEVFMGSWEATASAVRSSKKKVYVPKDALYDLDPLDPRLYMMLISSPSEQWIMKLLDDVTSDGYEGLVLRQGDSWLKVKKEETHDVEVTGFVEGKGKHVGRMGLLKTPLGNVGTGFKDLERKELFGDHVIGTIIEVESMGLTPKGKFRHPRFVRVRFDKSSS